MLEIKKKIFFKLEIFFQISFDEYEIKSEFSEKLFLFQYEKKTAKILGLFCSSLLTLLSPGTHTHTRTPSAAMFKQSFSYSIHLLIFYIFLSFYLSSQHSNKEFQSVQRKKNYSPLKEGIGGETEQEPERERESSICFAGCFFFIFFFSLHSLPGIFLSRSDIVLESNTIFFISFFSLLLIYLIIFKYH